jgi:hypothetical protein
MSTFSTLTYSEAVKGWPSFYSYNPDWMIGMNQFFYTFNGGNLFEHNTSALRNTFYGQYQASTIKSVFNDIPLENKLFKTLNLEGDSAWAAQLVTDIQNSGFIQPLFYEKKEGSFFGFVRNSGNPPTFIPEYRLRSVNGIGRSVSVTGTSNAPIITFPNTIAIGSILSVGDFVYFALPPLYNIPQLGGRLTAIDKANNTLTLDATIAGAISPIPSQVAFYLFLKDSVAESHGVLGHYCVFELTNDLTTATELFVVNSEVMKSFP